jgi:hypothetical protein
MLLIFTIMNAFYMWFVNRDRKYSMIDFTTTEVWTSPMLLFLGLKVCVVIFLSDQVTAPSTQNRMINLNSGASFSFNCSGSGSLMIVGSDWTCVHLLPAMLSPKYIWAFTRIVGPTW